MAKTWENYECEFYTSNTTNARGDSKYLVLSDKMARTALINFKRAPSQVLAENPSIAYLEPNGELFKAIMATAKDSDITIVGVTGDRVTVNVNGSKKLIADCTRKPANGLNTFDFTNNDGVLTHIHVGHEVKLLTLGRPRRNSV